MSNIGKSRRKYVAGDRITSLDEFVEQEFVIVHGKVYNRGWAFSWSIWLVKNYLARGCYKAVPIDQATNDQPRGEGPR